MRDGAKRDLARKLRVDLTPHERKLWYLLRDRRFGTVKFRRQYPVGPYVADFAAVAGSSSWTAPSMRQAKAILAATRISEVKAGAS